MSRSEPLMTAADVLYIVQLFREHGIDPTIDGGWGVDALLGRQTRSHTDLDIAVAHKDVPLIRSLLEARGFSDVPRDDTWECNFVLGDPHGRQVDIHSYTFDAADKPIFGVPYPYDSLTGAGVILGVPVKCISLDWMVKFHTGYKLDENDYRDVRALGQHFNIPIPTDYAEFEKNDPDRYTLNPPNPTEECSMSFFNVIQNRHSIRAYLPRPVEPEKIQQLLEATNRAPTAGNLQAFEVYLVTDAARKAQLVTAAAGQGFLAQAPLILIFCAHPARSAVRYGKRGTSLYATQDATIACSFAMLAAAALELSSVWVGAFDEAAVRQVANIPEDHRPVAMLPVGYAAEEPRIRLRRDLGEFVHHVN